jgi:DNA-binding transcriptional LysR family regulator
VQRYCAAGLRVNLPAVNYRFWPIANYAAPLWGRDRTCVILKTTTSFQSRCLISDLIDPAMRVNLMSVAMPRKKTLPKGISESTAVNLTSIRWVLAVADHLSFRGAARELGVGHGAVSRRVRALEDALGVSLFERSHWGLRLTNAGARFIQETREALHSLELASRAAAEAGQGGTGDLRIGIQPSIGAGFLRELIRTYSARYPDVVIKLREGTPPADHVALVRQRQLDVAFVADTTEAADCDTTPLWKERLFIALPDGHALAKNTLIDWRELRQEHFIVRQAKCEAQLCERVVQRLADAGRSPAIEKLDVGRETIMHLVGIRQGVSITTESTLAMQYPDVIFRPICGGDEMIGFKAVWLASNDNPALRRFISLAKVRAKQNRRDPGPPSNAPPPNTALVILSVAFLGALVRRLGLST